MKIYNYINNRISRLSEAYILKFFKIVVIGLGVLAFSFGIFMFWYETIYMYNKWIIDYPNIKKYKSYEGKVIDVFASHATAYITLENTKLSLTFAKLIKKQKSKHDYVLIESFIEKGDYFRKPQHIDSIYLTRGDTVYKFHLYSYFSIDDPEYNTFE